MKSRHQPPVGDAPTLAGHRVGDFSAHAAAAGPCHICGLRGPAAIAQADVARAAVAGAAVARAAIAKAAIAKPDFTKVNWRLECDSLWMTL